VCHGLKKEFPVKISGNYTIDAPQELVWEALNDMEVLARIVPGCERLEQTGENEFEGTVKIGIQAIKGTYNGRIRLEDIQPPTHYKLVANGRSANGVVDGAGTIDLSEVDGKTLLKYSGDAQVGGMLASVGQRLIEGAAKQMINQSLKALSEQIALRAKGGEPPAAPEPPSAPTPPAAAEPPAATASSPAPEPPAAAEPPAASSEAAPASFERRTVVVPADQQLKPEAVVFGIAEDLIKERPWLPWVIIAFLVGVLLGRRRA
jgi:carbon monoxide dehydrogenase subunit G